METATETPPAAAPASPPVATELRVVPVAQLREHPDNPRKQFDPATLAELAASVKEMGILNPLLVRAARSGQPVAYQVLAGARRYRAAKLAGVAEVPVLVRDLDDAAALELMVTDNQQRQDVHPLEEAQGYHLLNTKARLDVAHIAAKIGLSVKYVYDRIKLLSLTKEAQKAFLAGDFTAGHAVILARLKPEDQKRALEEHGALFTDERYLFTPDEEDELPADYEPRKPRSVRELQAWVDEHTKLEAHEADPMLFPETVATVREAMLEKEKVVRITHDEMTPEEAKGGPPVILGRSWKRADGQRGSKQCDHSVVGMIVIGAGRGQALRVCTDKQRCLVHWGEQIKARQKRERAVTKTAARTGEDREALRRRKEQEEQAQRKAEEERWEKAEPAIVHALAAVLKRAPAGSASVAGKYVLSAFEDDVLYGQGKEASKHLPTGKSAEDLVRHMAFRLLAQDLSASYRRDEFMASAKAFGVDVAKILDQAAPVAPTEKPKLCVERAGNAWYVCAVSPSGQPGKRIETHSTEASALKSLAKHNGEPAPKRPAAPGKAKAKSKRGRQR